MVALRLGLGAMMHHPADIAPELGRFLGNRCGMFLMEQGEATRPPPPQKKTKNKNKSPTHNSEGRPNYMSQTKQPRLSAQSKNH